MIKRIVGVIFLLHVLPVMCVTIAFIHNFYEPNKVSYWMPYFIGLLSPIALVIPFCIVQFVKWCFNED